MKTLNVLILLILINSCWAGNCLALGDNCRGVHQQLPEDGVCREIISTLNLQVPNKEKQINEPFKINQIDKYMSKGDWHFVWTTPEHLERGVFVLRGTVPNFEYILVWGGVASSEEETSVLEWFVKSIPDAPVELLECVSYTITHGTD